MVLLWKQHQYAAKHDVHAIGRSERKFFLTCFVAFSFFIVALLIGWFGQPDRPIPSQFGQAALRVRQALLALLIAMGALIIGWIGCHLICLLLRRGLRRVRLKQVLGQWSFDGNKARNVDVAQWASRAVYYVLMLLVLIVFFQLLGLASITEPLNRLLDQIAQFLPRVLGAGLLLLFAWALASILKLLITGGLAAIGFDKRIGKEIRESDQKFSPGNSVAATAYWLVFLLFLPAILSVLQLPSLTAPIQAMLREAMGLLPNIVMAAVILVVGWFVAKALRRIVSDILASAGANLLSDRAGLAPVLGPQGFSNAVGVVPYTLILIPVLIAALNVLKL